MVLSLVGAFITQGLAFGANRGNEAVDHTVIFDFRFPIVAVVRVAYVAE